MLLLFTALHSLGPEYLNTPLLPYEPALEDWRSSNGCLLRVPTQVEVERCVLGTEMDLDNWKCWSWEATTSSITLSRNGRFETEWQLPKWAASKFAFFKRGQITTTVFLGYQDPDKMIRTRKVLILGCVSHREGRTCRPTLFQSCSSHRASKVMRLLQ